jgi:SAM-dependent methyltransferase
MAWSIEIKPSSTPCDQGFTAIILRHIKRMAKDMSEYHYLSSGYKVNDRLRTLQSILVCPICKSGLEFGNMLFVCTSCRLQFHQSSTDWFSLIPNQYLTDENSDWEERQVQMEGWYNDLVSDPENARELFVHDYAPYASYLANLSGLVLDIGGGIGITRHYLVPNTPYIVLDPSLTWLNTEWKTLSTIFPGLESVPCFIRGVGEYAPFASGIFDAVVAFWSLNHASDPKQVCQEIARVLLPGGRFLLVLEDMLPQWRDFLDRQFPAKPILQAICEVESSKYEEPPRLYLINRYFRNKWPLQSDHIRIHEADLLKWTSNNFEVSSRRWEKQFLTFEFKKFER